jgi:phosphohistidine phosphatase SixA
VPLVIDLLRHGDSLPASPDGDDARRLSPRGREDLQRLAAHLATLGWRPTCAFTSPLWRARDSAAIVLRGTAPGLGARTLDALRSESAPGDVLEALAMENVTEGHVFLVGHQPQLGLLGGLLTGGPAAGFSPGCLMRFEFAGALLPGHGTAGWTLAPGFTG